jgi:hypothetical protein
MAAPAYPWNNTGHMVAARLAWKALDDDQRSRAATILKAHPHFEEFLAADRPGGFSEDEWVFLRAATWPDWVRSHHTDEYHHATWHFINYPFVPAGSAIDPKEHQPPAGQEDIVRQLDVAVKKIQGGNREEQAVFLCWLLHLGGDIHQPLHCTALFSARYPDGDRGGNLAFIRLQEGTRKVKLHPLWDDLLGNGTSPAAIARVVKQVQTLLKETPDLIKDDVESHTSFESWAKESFEVARKDAYLNGSLPVGKEEDDDADIPLAPADYPKKAGALARVQMAKAGARLAATLKTVLK